MKVVELGGGSNPMYSGGQQTNGDYYVNVDVRKVEKVDFVTDFNKTLPFGIEEFDLIYSKFAIEHVSWRSLEGFIDEMYRILKTGGRVFVISPNARAQAEILASKKDWNLVPDVQMMFGDQNYGENAHGSSCSPELYQRLFMEAGFKNVITYPYVYWKGDMCLEAEK